ncbi:MAG TPA: prepilin peptidase [Myxococcales bacterium]|nr:prepilin peptidase [Myxococcales bacterium]
MQDLARGMPVAFAIWVFAFGAMVGSFLNVVIARVPKRQSIVSPGSRCPRCGSAIAWYDNIPIVSWILLRARCRKCGQPISTRYPLVELLMGVLAVAVVKRDGLGWVAVGDFGLVAALVALAYIDLDTWLLPHQITWPLLVVGLVSPLWNRELTWAQSLIGAAAGFALFAAIALIGEKLLKRETMGWGDVWLLAAIAGWLGWPALLPVVLLSAVQGAIVGSILLAVRREPEPSPPPAPAAPPSDEDWVPPKHAVPYGPFLSLAALEYLFFGDRIVSGWNHLIFRLLS